MVASLIKLTGPGVLAGRTTSYLLTSFLEHQLVSSYRFPTEEKQQMEMMVSSLESHNRVTQVVHSLRVLITTCNSSFG